MRHFVLGAFRRPTPCNWGRALLVGVIPYVNRSSLRRFVRPTAAIVTFCARRLFPPRNSLALRSPAFAGIISYYLEATCLAFVLVCMSFFPFEGLLQ